MNNNDWYFFKIIGEEKNLTRAAKKLFISQPTVTEKIKKLETEFNCKLITRQPRGIGFTPEGEMLYQYATSALKAFYRLKDDIANVQTGEVKGILRLGCSNVFAKFHLPKLIMDFHRVYPQVVINFRSGLSQPLYRDFLHGETQLVIVRGDHFWSEAKHLLWKEPICIFNKTPLDITNLAALPYIHYNTDPSMQSVEDEWWYTQYKTLPNTITHSDDMETVMRMVEGGLGYTILTESCGQSHPKLQKYPLLVGTGEILYRKTWLYHHNDAMNNPVQKAFIDFLLKRYGPEK